MNSSMIHTKHFEAALPFVEQSCLPRMSKQLSSVFNEIEIDVEDKYESSFSIRAATVGDWWFSWIKGSGRTVVSAGSRAKQLTNHALLVLVLDGENRSANNETLCPRVGEIALNPWDGNDAIVSSGEFSYLCAYIPRPILEQQCDIMMPYGRCAKTDSGAGSVLKAALCSLVQESLSARENNSLVTVLPAFSRLAIDTLGGCEAHTDNIGQSKRLTKVQSFLKINYTNPQLNLKFVSGQLGISERQICREFQEIGTSFASYLKLLRVQNAGQMLLENTETPIIQVAYSCGFTNPNTFCRSFRNVFDQTPMSYRLSKGG